MSNNRIYHRTAASVTADLGEEAAVLDLPSGAYLGFNPTGAFIWRLLAAPQNIDAICQALTAEFAVDHDRSHAEATALLDRLVKVGLVTVSEK